MAEMSAADVARPERRVWPARLLRVRIRLKTLAIAQSAALGLARTFGSGFGISHGSKNSGRERHGCAPGFVNRDAARLGASRSTARPWRRPSLPGPIGVLGVSGVTLAFSAPGFEESAVKTACVGSGADAGAETSVLLGRAAQFRQMVGRNLHDRANGQLRVELGDIRRFHPNTTVAGGPSDILFLRGTVNVNAPADRRARSPLPIRAAR